MNKSAREKRARAVLKWDANQDGITAEELAELAPMDLVDAKKALHSLWLKGGIKRFTRSRVYVYARKRPSA